MNLGGSVRFNKTGILSLIIVCSIIFYLYSYRKTESENLVDLRKLLNVAIKAAQNGGKEVVAVKDNLKIESKGRNYYN